MLFTKTPTFKTQPTKLFFFLQEDKAESWMSQNELSGRSQSHDASSHHGHVIRAERQRWGYRQFKFKLVTNNWLWQTAGFTGREEYLGQWFNVQLYMSEWATNRPLKLTSRETHDTRVVVDRLFVSTKRIPSSVTGLHQVNPFINLISIDYQSSGGAQSVVAVHPSPQWNKGKDLEEHSVPETTFYILQPHKHTTH